MGAQAVQLEIRKVSPSFGRTSGQDLVPRTLSSRTTGQGPGQLPKAFEVLRSERFASPTAEAAKEEVLVQIIQGHQILPIHDLGLGRGRTSSLSPGLQHVEFVDSPQKSQLLAFGLQFQLETGQDFDDQRA